MIWCLSKNQIPSWATPLRLWADLSVGLFSATMIFILLVLAYITQVFEHPQWDWNKIYIYGFACFVGMPCTFAPKSNLVRIGFVSFLFGCLLHYTTYTTQLALRVSKPIYELQLKTFNDIINARFDLSGDQFAFLELLGLNKVWVSNKLFNKSLWIHCSFSDIDREISFV